MAHRSAARLALVALMLSLAVFVPGSNGQALGAATFLSTTATADAWVNKAKAKTNYGSATTLRAQKGATESYLRFNLSAWLGLPIDSLHLDLDGLIGDASSLAVHRVGGGWKEGSLTWSSRPSVGKAAGSAKPSGSTVRFNLKPLFANGIIDTTTLNLRVSELAGAQVMFGSRESSAKPRIVLVDGPRLVPVGLPAVADTFANAARPARNFGGAKVVRVSAGTVREGYLSFDLSAWRGHVVERVELRLRLADSAGKGVRFYRVGTGWKEAVLTWNKRPTGGTLLATTTKSAAAGAWTIDLSSAFGGGLIDADRLGLRITTTSSDGFAFSSREGGAPPTLRLVPSASTSTDPTPSPSATPSATPKPTSSPSSSPTPTGSPSASPSPTSSPTASPSATPSPTASPSASPSPTPEPKFYFRGGGNAHGVGMSQYGARGRATAGQTYDQILLHYYTGTTLGVQDPATVVRVLLATAYEPTSTAPARVVAQGGSWYSEIFPDSLVTPFPAGSWAILGQDLEGVWTVSVHDANGLLITSTAAADVVMQPTDAQTIFYMKFRDSLRTYDRYRGQMRLRAAGPTTVQAVNIVAMNDYLKGVVPGEVPATWPREAVRAQAVAARSYVSFKLRTTNTWDVKPDSSHQVYGGVNLEHSASNAAVDATAGVVVLAPDGSVAETVFHAVAGGHTEHNEFAFVNSSGKPGSPVSYLRGVPDVDANGVAYENGVSGFSWKTDAFTMKQLGQMLAKDSRTDVGTLTSISFERGVSGRAYRVTITGSKGTKIVSGGVLQTVYNNNKLSGANLRSMLYYLEPVP